MAMNDMYMPDNVGKQIDPSFYNPNEDGLNEDMRKRLKDMVQGILGTDVTPKNIVSTPEALSRRSLEEYNSTYKGQNGPYFNNMDEAAADWNSGRNPDIAKVIAKKALGGGGNTPILPQATGDGYDDDSSTAKGQMGGKTGVFNSTFTVEEKDAEKTHKRRALSIPSLLENGGIAVKRGAMGGINSIQDLSNAIASILTGHGTGVNAPYKPEDFPNYRWR